MTDYCGQLPYAKSQAPVTGLLQNIQAYVHPTCMKYKCYHCNMPVSSPNGCISVIVVQQVYFMQVGWDNLHVLAPYNTPVSNRHVWMHVLPLLKWWSLPMDNYVEHRNIFSMNHQRCESNIIVCYSYKPKLRFVCDL